MTAGRAPLDSCRFRGHPLKRPSGGLGVVPVLERTYGGSEPGEFYASFVTSLQRHPGVVPGDEEKKKLGEKEIFSTADIDGFRYH